MLQQRAKIQWHKGGDQCSRIFFRKIAARWASQKIFQINSEHGDTVSEESAVVGEFVRFYMNLLGAQRRNNHINLMFLQPWARYVISQEEEEAMVRPVEREEVKNAVFDIAEDKAPGSDGYSAGFFKAAWSVIGTELTVAIQDFFISGKMLKQVNATVLSLIPKVANPTTVAEFRPISCCSVLYKTVTKIIVQRMQTVMDKIISPSHNAFVPVDLRKAYDTLEWDFINAMLHVFGFPDKFIMWIVECISTTAFLVSLKEMKLFNLCFADDLLLFCKVEEQSVALFRDALQEFAGLSGLHANINKSQLILSKSASTVRQTFTHGPWIPGGYSTGKISWAPLISSRLTADDCKPLLLKVDERLQGWSSLRLSFAARVQLLKSVISALHVYWAMAFILPKGILKAVEARMRKFLWQGGQESGAGKTLLGPYSVQQILNLGDMDINSGEDFWLWQDPWHPLGPLIHRFPNGPRVVGIPLEAKVCVVIDEHGWNWPLITDIEHMEIVEQLSHLDTSDMIGWKSAGGGVSISEAYRVFQPPGPTCDYSMVYLWILEEEVRFGWQHTILWSSRRWRVKHPWNATSRALFASLVYHIWMERNKRRFGNSFTNPEHTARLCIEQIRLTLIGADLSLNRKLFKLKSQPEPNPSEVTRDKEMLNGDTLRLAPHVVVSSRSNSEHKNTLDYSGLCQKTIQHPRPSGSVERSVSF
ncbi:UNVERIFIED_CONTAM: LINE-1 retrotransposable element O protein [Sesamum latifolium]|uniref:LINE-1 retrotransposable element O protein n=1 Tax=Sesamum latifolium TaxID=2727402 RepID=A0AAW2WU15_9LAMI